MEEQVGPSREEQVYELLVVLFLIVPSVVLSLFAFGPSQVGFVLLALATIFRDLALVALILFFLWRNGEPLARIGWTGHQIATNVILGLILSPIVILGIGLLNSLLRAAGLSGPSPAAASLVPHGPGEIALAVILVIVVAVSEETIFRGYMIARLAATSRSMAFAVVVSSGIFAIGHGYEGTAGLTAVGVMGLVFALLLVWRRSLVAPVVIHFANDFLAIVVAPLLGLM